LANFQIGHSALFPDGAQLFANGKSGEEKLILHSGNKIRLELAGMADSATPPIVKASQVNVLKLSDVTKAGNKWVFTVEALGAGKVKLSAVDSKGRVPPELTVNAGVFKNHPNMEQDLIADVYKGIDPGKMYAITRILHNDPENLVNENSNANIQKWGDLACGTVAKVAGQKLFYPKTDYDYHEYYKIAPKLEGAGPHRHQVWRIDSREEVTYDPGKLTQGEKAIQARLKKGQPCVVGLTYIPSSSIQRGGSLSETGAGGHTVLIIASDHDAKKFLYFDPFGPDADKSQRLGGSILQYQGGMEGLNTFPDRCRYLGMFAEIPDPVRGPVLRQVADTQDPDGTFTGDQFLEVISGPMH